MTIVNYTATAMELETMQVNRRSESAKPAVPARFSVNGEGLGILSGEELVWPARLTLTLISRWN